ncbi:OmcA/MtrC family decaheme c-type cytochrome [Shewanella sp. A32]|uniref:OmcA/MtrC family decaheme c-type cytochrome n=1 Tax=Shewanella sp. A32 TaxID=3031327 RepID=UPI0023B8D8D3|nr:OmcA/MtrC family decaheme c-type cytochrome [Shewanella sp. A32]MDF0535685.1 OmcA/MtrC family decaheme c-type cytochrome [Shewanella sp. A32]
MMKNHNKSLLALFLVGLFGLSACTFDGSDGKDGVDGTNGTNGTNGQDGKDASSAVSAAYKAGDVTLTIKPEESTLAGAGTFMLKFTATAKDQLGDTKPLSGLNKIRLFAAAVVANTSHDGPALYWNPVGSSMYCTDNGLSGSSNACTLVEDPANPGSYTGTWTYDGAAPIMAADDDLNAPHRIVTRIYNVKDANSVDGAYITDNILSTLTYIPATGETGVASGKDTVSDSACKGCHGENPSTGGIWNIKAHGSYQSVQNCVLCHNPSRPEHTDPKDKVFGRTVDLPAMIHRIHAGAEIAPTRVVDAASGLTMGDLGFIQDSEWVDIKYPAPLTECTVCHSNDEGKTTWKTEPTRAACGGCHSNINFATGENHFGGIGLADDSQCKACHSSGNYSPEVAHNVGKRAEYAKLVTVDFTKATAAVNATDSSKTDVTLTVEVSINGTPVTDASVLKAYDPNITTKDKSGNVITNSAYNPTGMFMKDSLIIGTVDSTGEVTAWSDKGVSTPKLSAFDFTDGVGTLTVTVPAAIGTGTIYVGTEDSFCADNGAAVSCGTADAQFGSDNPIGVTSTVKFIDVDGGTAVTARFDDPARITVAESKCNACHSTLDYAKGSHGVYTFDQCMQCHNNTHAGSSTRHVDGYVDADGNLVPTGVVFANRDLVTVAHRMHSGHFGETEGIVLAKDGTVTGYPGVQGDCSACHKDGASFFAADGGLTSGKRSIAVLPFDTNNDGTIDSKDTTYYVSPVAESCRSCHTSESAAAHFSSNGAIMASDKIDDPNDISIESCATCHAQDKSFGIEKFHVIK